MFRTRRTSRASALFFLLSGAVLTVLLAAVVLQRYVADRQPAAFPITPDFSALLPKGNLIFTMNQVFEEPAPAYIVGFGVPGAGAAEISLVYWDKQRYRYAASAPVPLVALQGKMNRVSRMRVVPLGGGAPTVIVVNGSTGDGAAEHVMLAERRGSSLLLLSVRDGATASPAFFLQGQSARSLDAFSIEDVSGDGRGDLIASSVASDAGSSGSATYRVYEYRNGVFEYDQELSWALQTSRRVFPSP